MTAAQPTSELKGAYAVALHDSVVLNVRDTTDVSAPTIVKDFGEVMYVEDAPVSEAKADLQDGEAMDGVDYSKSRPPSPPESGTTTPALRIAKCPSRLLAIVPPVNYGAVEDGAIFRSAFPQDRNIGFLRLLDVKNVLCLVGTEPPPAYNKWLAMQNIKRTRIDIAPNKDGKIKTTWDSLCEAILFLMDSANWPLYIHCNQGKHRTGCIIACYRKVQRQPIEDILAEYDAYASPKARSGDIDLIRAFDPEAVYDYAKSRGYFTNRDFMKKVDSTVCNIDSLAAALSAGATLDDSNDWSVMSHGSSTTSDEGIQMRRPNAASTAVAVNSTSPAGISSTHSNESAIMDDDFGDFIDSSFTPHPIPRATNNSQEDPGATTIVTELLEDVMSPPPVGETAPILFNPSSPQHYL